MHDVDRVTYLQLKVVKTGMTTSINAKPGKYDNHTFKH